MTTDEVLKLAREARRLATIERCSPPEIAAILGIGEADAAAAVGAREPDATRGSRQCGRSIGTKPRRRKGRRREERREQVALFAWIAICERIAPAMRLVFHVPNGEARDPRTGAALKAMGVRRGVPDVIVPTARLAIEMKAPGKRSRVTTEQAEFASNLRAHGWRVEVADDWTDAARMIGEACGVPESMWPARRVAR